MATKAKKTAAAAPAQGNAQPIPHGKGPLDHPTYADLVQLGLARVRTAEDDQ